jgi:predicted DNA-binding protein
MPTANPRISITLKPSLAAVLRELSELAGNSQSAIVAELLETSQPVFEKMVLVLRASAKVRDAAKQDLAAGLERAQGRLEQQLGLISDEFDGVTRPLLEAAERIDRRSGRGATARSAGGARPGLPQAETPPSNRGVRYPNKRAKKPTAARA